MAFINNNKNRNFSIGKNNQTRKIKIDLDLDIIYLMGCYTLSNNPLVNKRGLMNLRKLLNSIEIDKSNYELYSEIELIKTILEGCIEHNIFRYELLKKYCLSNKNIDEEVLDSKFKEFFEDNLSDSDINFINNYVEERLTYLYLYENKENLEFALEKLNNTASNARESSLFDVNLEFEKVIGKIYKSIQSAKAASKYSAMDFSFSSHNLDTVVKTTINELNQPTNFINTGLKSLNRMLGGGLENGRCYIFFALPKSFKSGLLLNIALWACQYNNFTPSSEDKIPTVLYLTQENSIKETLERTFIKETGKEIKDFTIEEATKILRDNVIGNKNVDLDIKYRPNKSISTNDLDAMIDDLALEGKEVVLVIQDYTKRIRSSMNYPDIRLELGEVTNDLTVIAKTRNIPVISAGQLNRKFIAAI